MNKFMSPYTPLLALTERHHGCGLANPDVEITERRDNAAQQRPGGCEPRTDCMCGNHEFSDHRRRLNLGRATLGQSRPSTNHNAARFLIGGAPFLLSGDG